MNIFLLIFLIVFVAVGLAAGISIALAIVKTVARATKTEPNNKGFLAFAIFGAMGFIVLAMMFLSAFISGL